MLAAVPAWAGAHFPTGVYSAKGLAATVTFDDKGRIRVEKAGVLEVEGDYTIKGGEVRLTDKRGPWACTKAGEETGTYNWKYDKGALAFTKVADACADRSESLANQAWTKK
jgi:hypothetical protein